jgi:hypothetical protein
LAVRLCEELSSRGGIVGNESAWNAQAGTRSHSELSLFVFGGALALEIVDPACIVERIEKTFERGNRLSDAHRSIALVKIVSHARWPEFAGPDGAHLRRANLLTRFRKEMCGAFIARAGR